MSGRTDTPRTGRFKRALAAWVIALAILARWAVTTGNLALPLLMALIGLIGLGVLYFAQRQSHAPSLRNDELAGLECDAEYAARELLHQCDQTASLLSAQPGADVSIEHVAEIRSLAIALATDRSAIERLTRQMDPDALGYAVQALREKATKVADETTAHEYEAALRMRESQQELLRRLGQLKETGDGCWEHLSAVLGELSAKTALRSAADAVQSQRDALNRLTEDLRRYNEGVVVLDASLRSSG